MGFPNIFDFQKLTVTSAEETPSPLPNSDSTSFEAMFNPSTLSIKYENKFAPDEAIKAGNTDGTSSSPGRKPRFMGRDIARVQIKLLLDGTRVTDFGLLSGLGFAEGYTVEQRIQDFLSLAIIPAEATHQANTLILNWGKIISDFHCNLKSVNISYTLFDRDGAPLRAELDCLFTSTTPQGGTSAGLINLSSPDLTHKRIVNAGDTLPALCKEIYGNAAYYLQVAAVNQLDNFRSLEAGTVLYFPPIQKTSA